jgi:uncharacterized membrane protein
MILLSVLLACAEAPDADTGPSAAARCGAVSWDAWADGFVATHCRACHSASSPDRHGAPEGVDFDVEDDLLRHGARVRARVLEEGTMPIGGGVPQDELTRLDAYLSCVGVP